MGPPAFSVQEAAIVVGTVPAMMGSVVPELAPVLLVIVELIAQLTILIQTETVSAIAQTIAQL
jgi:hypothetical protein